MKIIRIISLILAVAMPLPNAHAMARLSEYFAPSVELPMPGYTPQALPELQGYLPSYLMPSKLVMGIAGASLAALTTYIVYKEYKRRTAPKLPVMLSIFDTTNADVTTFFEFLWLFNNAYTYRLVTKNIIGRTFGKSDELAIYNKYNRNFMQEHTTGIRSFNVTALPKVQKLLADANLLRTRQNAHIVKTLEGFIIGLYKAISDANWKIQGWLFTTKAMDQNELAAIVGDVATQFHGIYETLEALYKKLDITDQKLPGEFIDSLGADRTIHKVDSVWNLAIVLKKKTIENFIRTLPPTSNTSILDQHFLPTANKGTVTAIAIKYTPKPGS